MKSAERLTGRELEARLRVYGYSVKQHGQERAATFFIGNDEYHVVNPPPGWRRVEERADGVAWAHNKRGLAVIASVAIEGDGKRWLHVSCSHARRPPTHDDMADVKCIFIGDEQYAIVVYPPWRLHVNIHPNCLHLWSCLDGHPLPEFSGAGSI